MTKATTVPPVDTLRAHATEIAQAFDVRLIECAALQPHEAFANARLRAAFVGRIVDETTYAVALHEVGHLAAPLGVLRAILAEGNTVNLSLDEEDAAWQWARHYALVWTPVMDALANWAEGTYKAAAQSSAAPSAPVAPQPETKIDWTKWSRK
jgi:hypothetical protein